MLILPMVGVELYRFSYDSPGLSAGQRRGYRVATQLAGLARPAAIPALEAPGNLPYKEGGKPSGITPASLTGAYKARGACGQACPTAAIWVNGTATTDYTLSIMCCACVLACPNGARVIQAERILKAAERLSTNCAEPRQPELFGLPAFGGSNRSSE